MKISAAMTFGYAFDFSDLDKYHLYKCGQNGYLKINEEEKKVFPIKKAHTVVDPWTMMIHV